MAQMPTSKIDPAFGEWLRKTRSSIPMTAQELADASDLNRGTITGLENTRRLEAAFSIEVFQRLARGLNMELGYVLHKAGFDLGRDGIDLGRLRRVEIVTEAFAEHQSALRVALAEAILVLEDESLSLELGRGLAALDQITEQLRSEQFIATRVNPKRVVARPWTESEHEFMRQNPQLTNEDAAQQLGRTAQAVRVWRLRNRDGGES